MALLCKRLERLERKQGGAAPGHSVILLCSGENGEPMAALLLVGGSLLREDGEPVEAFTARAMVEASLTIQLPDNACDMPNG